MYLIKSNSLTIFFGLFLKKELFVDFCKEGCRRSPAEAVNSDASCWVLQCVLAPSSLCSYLHVVARGQQELPDFRRYWSATWREPYSQFQSKEKGSASARCLSTDQLSSGHWLAAPISDLVERKSIFSMAIVGWGLRLDSLDKVWHSLAVRANKYIGAWYYVLQLSCETFSVLEDSFIPGTDFFLGLFK